MLALYAGTCWNILNVTITPMRKLPTVAPGQLGFSTAKELASKSAEDGVLLRGWLVPSTGSRAIVLVHGINSHAWDGHAPEVVRAYVDAGFHVLHICGPYLGSSIFGVIFGVIIFGVRSCNHTFLFSDPLKG